MRKIILLLILILIPGFASAQVYLWRYRNHATDCTALTDGKLRDLCYEEDSHNMYKCVPSVGDCSGAEWILVDDEDSETNSLEVVTTGIAVTEIPIGTGTDTVVYNSLSGDATMNGDGIVTVVDNLHGHTESNISDLSHTPDAHASTHETSGSDQIHSMFDDDDNTGIQVEESSDENIIRFDTAGTERLTIDASGNMNFNPTATTTTINADGSAVFNEQGNDADFRVEGQGNTHLIFSDASTDRVGFGSSTTYGKVTITGDADEGQLVVVADAGQTDDMIKIQDSGLNNVFVMDDDGHIGMGGSNSSINAFIIMNQETGARSALQFTPIQTSGTISANIYNAIYMQTDIGFANNNLIYYRLENDSAGTNNAYMANMSAGLKSDLVLTQGVQKMYGIAINMTGQGTGSASSSGGTVDSTAIMVNPMSDYAGSITTGLQRGGDIGEPWVMRDDTDLCLEGDANSIGDTCMRYDSTKTAIEIDVDGTQVMELDNDVVEVNVQFQIDDTNTGGNAGTDICIDANNQLCACGSCA